MAQNEKKLTASVFEKLVLKNKLAIVRMETRQTIPDEYIKAYGSEVNAYAHEIGKLISNTPDFTVDTLIKVVKNETGPHKDAVLEALNLIDEKMKTDKENFLQWCSVSKV